MAAELEREDTIPWDEPTDAHLSQAAILDRRFLAAIAEVLADDGGGTASLVVAARGGGATIAMACRDGAVTELRQPGSLDEAIASGLGADVGVEHLAVFRTDGAQIGVVAVGRRDRAM